MNYSDKNPEKVGFYWVKGLKHPATGMPYENIVEYVNIYDGRWFLVFEANCTDCWRVDEFVEAEWAGPIPKPANQETRCAPVQGAMGHYKRGEPGYAAGTVSWVEHEAAWRTYAARYGRDQSAERIAERGGFSYGELVMFLGHKPETWKEKL